MLYKEILNVKKLRLCFKLGDLRRKLNLPKLECDLVFHELLTQQIFFFFDYDKEKLVKEKY